MNNTIFRPLGLEEGTYTVDVTFQDEVGNEVDDFSFTFDVVERATYDVPLDPGANLVSIPADPVNGDINVVFGGEAAITLVMTFDNKTGLWLVASRDTDPESPTFGQLIGNLTSIDARDYARLLHLREDYGVTELRVESGDWIAGRTLDQAGVVQEGILVLGIECPGGSFIGAPAGNTEIRAGDRLCLYGRVPRIAELDRRGSGDNGLVSHEEGVREQQSIAADERSRAGR